MDDITNGVSETRLCFFLNVQIFFSLPEKRESYLHISEKSCNFALAKDTSMTDTEYIQAFRARNNKAISLFYREYRESFMAFLANRFHSLNQQLLAEVFQE